MTSFVTVLVQITCLCGYRRVLYYFKVNISVLERFMKSGIGIMDTFPIQPHHFLQSQSSFWISTWTSFVAILAQNTCVYGCRLVLYQFKFTIISLSRFMKPGMGIIDGFLLYPHHFLSNRSPFWWKID